MADPISVNALGEPVDVRNHLGREPGVDGPAGDRVAVGAVLAAHGGKCTVGE